MVANKRIAIIEDNPMNLFVACDMIEADLEGQVSSVDGFASARAFWEAQPHVAPDLILLDLQLPGENWRTILLDIRARLPNARVVALTANVMPSDVENVLSAGADGFIGKPIDRDRFPQQIQRVLKGEPVWEPR